MSFNDGVFCQKLSDNAALSSALAVAIPHGHHVADFALAHASDGLAFTIDQVVDNPLRLIFDYSGDGISSHAVVVFKLLPGAELTILEEHKGGGAGLSAPVMLFCLEEGAKLHHARRLIESDQRYHLGLNLVQQKSKSVYSGDMVMAGGEITRSETQVSLMEADAQSCLNAVYLGRDAQMRDVTSRIDHDAPDCQSFQRIHGVLDNQSKAVFQGKVKVERYAQKTDGNQMSRTLILSRDAEANTKPELEIYADDVTCSHGATIGELDSDQLFYLMSRGIGCDEARQMLIEAFLVDVVDELDDPKREWLIEPIEHWIKTRVS
jgi:Fe-S cluster assembly protein SufD